MDCSRCGGDCTPQKVPLALRLGESEYAIIHSVPADVCTRCGENHFSIQTSILLMKILRKKEIAERSAHVSVYNLSET